jgi:glycosyltransferase involved in cell wall biosynthesis
MNGFNIATPSKITKVPQVSIGMPVYNGAKFIREALNSLLMQTFANFELIISDNASTDETETICREYAAKDERIRYVRQAYNLGPVTNFEFVLNEAVCEFFMWAAADDVWDKRWIDALLPISTDNQCLAYGMVQTIDSKSKIIQHPANERKFNYIGSKFFRRLKYFSEPTFLGKSNPIYGIYPKCIITPDVFNVFASAKAAPDYFFIYRLLKDIEIRGGTEVFLYKRIHDDCWGGGAETISIKKKNLWIKILKLPIQIINILYHEIVDYGVMSNTFERTAQILLAPIIFIINVYYVVANNSRFKKK